MDPGLQELLRNGAHDDSVSAIVRINPREPLPAHIHVVARFGDIATVRIRRGDVPEAYASDGIDSFKATRLLMPEPVLHDADDASVAATEHATHAIESMQTLHTTRAGPSDIRRHAGMPTGRNAIVACLDWGLDFTHSEFRTADGHTRLLALWDQSARYDAAFPNRYGYGRVYRTNAIDRALASGNPFATLGYDGRRSDRGIGTHGTHVMGIAAGRTLGVAPAAPLMFVHLATSSGRSGAVPLTDSAAVLEALHFIDTEAAARLACINMSLGTHGGPHDGTSLVEQGIDAFIAGSPRRIVVQSTGNYYAKRAHAAGTLRPGEHVSLPIVIDAADTTANDIEAWYRGVDECIARVRSPDGRVVATAALGARARVMDGDVEVGRLYHRRSDPNNSDHQVQLNLDAPAATGRWHVELQGVRIVDGRWNAWIERDTRCVPCQPVFPADRAASHSTTGSICNGRQSIVVGAFDAHQRHAPIGRFSSSGPTRDGRPKPDLVAPGVRVLSARSAPRRTARRTPATTRMSGTSMAAPHVTGAAALLCEAAGRTLSAWQVRELLCTTATPHAALTDADRLRAGSGRLDLAAALHAAHALRTARPQTPETAMQPTDTHDAVMASIALPQDSESMRGEGVHDAIEAVRQLEAAGQFDAETARSSDAIDAGEYDEYVVRRRRPAHVRGPRFGGPIIAPVIGVGVGGGIGASLVAPIGGGMGLALPLGGSPVAPAPATAHAPQAASQPPAPGCACPPATSAAPVAHEPVVVASDTPTQPAAEHIDESARESVWLVTERDAAQAADSILAEHAFVESAGEAMGASAAEAFASESSEFGAHAAGIEHIDGFDEIADAAVKADPLQDAARFVIDLLARAGAGEQDESFDEHALASPVLPARLYDHFSGRRSVLPDAIARRFDVVALPGAALPPLAAGDWMLRRGEGGFGHVSVLASPRVWPATALLRDGFDLERGHGGFVHVIEPGHRAARREDRFARRICDGAQRVRADTLVLRPQPGRARGRIDIEAFGEHVDARWIQTALNRILGIELVVDGQIGAQSRAAIRVFQGQHGLVPDGVVGARTEEALRIALDRAGAPTTVGSTTQARPPTAGGGTTGSATSDCTTLDAFEQGRDTLQPAHHTLLVGVARRIQREGFRLADVTGFASSEGDEASNLALGLARANNVVRALRETLERMPPGSSSGVALVPLTRGENDLVPGGEPRNRRVVVCLRRIAPPAPPRVPVQTRLFSVTGKSFIDVIGSNIGSLDCGIDIGPLRIPGASNQGLRLLALATDAAFSENPADDRISSRHRGYRLFSQGEVQAQHRGNELVALTLRGGLVTDSGKECPLRSTDMGCLQPPPLIIDQPFSTSRLDASRMRFRWAVRGRPHDRAEQSFQAICHRDSVFIWHVIKGVMDCSSGTPMISSLIIEGSRFPSHRVFADNVPVRPHVRQGPMSNLWDGTPGDPTRIR